MMDEAYDPKHKASSVTSTTSTSTNGTAPSLFSGTSSVGGGDLDDFGAIEALDPTASLSIPADEDYFFLTKQDEQCIQPPAQDILDKFFDMQSLEMPPPAPQQPSAQTSSSLSSSSAPAPAPQQHEELPSRKRRTSVISQDSNTNVELPQDKRIRDLLTDEERRANHIASEQKRRNTIRTGFKELTDIIPTLKNINNSKSTILFKAVEYVRHLEKRNRGLRDKLASLQLRLEVESRFGRRHQQQTTTTTSTTGNNHGHRYSTTTSASNENSASSCRLAPETLAALMAHKKQQRQLELLQEQLRMQQELLAKHNIAYPTSTSHINIPSSSSHHNTFSTPFASPRRHSTLPTTATTTQHGGSFHRLYGATNAPSLNIPADEEFNTEHKRREQLLSCHRNYKPSRSTSLT
ncbi:hypothetical protein O0I10_001837 [Lichtheimia ornata]|uniref:BHLH domain-containing protein n=1 Tax=Lichtheimia ornata TaxID=688661 RepID=A0AAD7VAS0_9FUNG|nr:uncharacterized protein O0I10_001837 [Lichtheimia ornata]KAJ8662144.1 hypothetical protein O0I10_001837 [Lichtheimia ornata]